MSFRLPPAIQKELDPLGDRWRLAQGKKHVLLLIDDRLVTKFPRGASMIRDSHAPVVLHVRQTIRRFIEKRS